MNKVRRQLVELQSSLAPEDRADVWVEGATPEGYLQRFAWNEAKYPSRRPLKDIVGSIMDTVQKLDDDLKARLGCWDAGRYGVGGWGGTVGSVNTVQKLGNDTCPCPPRYPCCAAEPCRSVSCPPPCLQLKVTEYGQLRSTLQAAARKQGGSLAVRDLAGVVPPGRLVETENLITLCAVVGKQAKADWLAQYEGLAEFVVPRSSEVRAAGGRGRVLGGVLWAACRRLCALCGVLPLLLPLLLPPC